MTRARVQLSPTCPAEGTVLVAWPDGLGAERVLAVLRDAGVPLEPAAVDALSGSPVAAWAGGRVVAALRPAAGAGPFGWRRAAETASLPAGDLVVLCADAAPAGDELEALVEGLLSRPDAVAGVTVVCDDVDADGVRVRAAATALARALADLPGTELTPMALAERAREIARETGLECEVLDAAELERRGFGGLLQVGRGSPHPPCLVDLRTPGHPGAGGLTLVGKGITFDSGGIQVKGESMAWMRADMAGAATVLAAARAAAELRCATPVRALLACAENRGGPDAYLPGDVIAQYDGSRTEIAHTDAEGRLVLADAIAYAREARPAAIVDVATLTDPFSVGPDIACVMGTSAELVGRLRAAGERAGEPAWEMPLWPGYREWLSTRRADRRNMASGHVIMGFPVANTVIGGLFLEPFAADVPWAHLDVAGPGMRPDRDTGDMLATGFGASLLTRLILSWEER